MDIDTYDFGVKAKGVDLTGTANPINIELLIGDDTGKTNIKLEGALQF